MVMVDSNVLLDVITADPIWCTWSTEALQRLLDAGPAIPSLSLSLHSQGGVISCGQSPRGLSRAWRSTPDDPSRFPHWRPCPRGRNPAPHPRSTSLPPGLPRAHADQPRSRSHRGTLIETCQRQDVQIEKESARLARFKREHLRGSNPLSSTGDSSPS